MSDVLSFESVKNALKSVAERNSGEISRGTRQNYKDALNQYLTFCNSREGSQTVWDPDALLAEALEDPKRAEQKIRDFYRWLQGKQIDGYKSWSRKMRASSARQRSYSQVRGFYTNNGVAFSKNFRVPTDVISTAIEADADVPFFRIDEDKREIHFDRSLIQVFLSNLKLRDQAVTLALLSTSQDSGDLFKLDIDWARRQWKKERFYWHAMRRKTRVPFKMFFTKEATEYTKRYIEQERGDAKPTDPISIKAGNSGVRRLAPKNLAAVFRTVADKMSVNSAAFQNPLRPKRLRHIFRTACSYAGIEEGYTHVFMGHKTDISARYLEKPVPVLELEYSKLEPMITVYRPQEVSGVAELQHEVSDWKSRFAETTQNMQSFQEEIGRLQALYEVERDENRELRAAVTALISQVRKNDEAIVNMHRILTEKSGQLETIAKCAEFRASSQQFALNHAKKSLDISSKNNIPRFPVIPVG